MTLYHVTWCPECAIVRQKLEDLDVPYESILVPDFRPMREQVYDVSGQYYVPVLKDGQTVLTETRDILEYLETRYSNENRANAQQSAISDVQKPKPQS